MKSATFDDQDELFGLPGPRNDTGSSVTGRVSRELRRALIDNHGSSPALAHIGPESADRLALFSPVITAVRLATTAISLLLAGPLVFDGDTLVCIAAALVVTFATFRSFRPLAYRAGIHSLVLTLAETALHLCIVVATGLWLSPFAFTLVVPVVMAGFARGFGFGLRIAVVAAAAVSVPTVMLASDQNAAVACQSCGARCSYSSRSSRRTDEPSRAKPTVNAISPSTVSGDSPTPTPCCIRSTRWPRRCRPRST